MQSESGEEHIPASFLGSLLKSYWKGEIHTEDPYSNFVSLHPFPDCKDVDARLYIEIADGIDG